MLSRHRSPVIWGLVSGHLRFGDTMMATSRLIAIDYKAGWARSISRWFRLADAIPGGGMSGQPSATLSEAKRRACASQFDIFVPLDDTTLLDCILADFISQARAGDRGL